MGGRWEWGAAGRFKGYPVTPGLAASLAPGATPAVTTGLLGTVTNTVAFAIASKC